MEENEKKQPSEPPPDFETRPELAPMIAQLRAEQTVEPGPDFTRRVMTEISAVQSEMTAAADANRQMKKRAASLMRYLTDTPSVADIGLCFLLAGFFYFLLAAIFFLGLQNLPPLPATAAWLQLQPQVAMVTAGGLGTIGLLLLVLASRIVMRLARIGTIVYIAFSIFNGAWISLESTGPYSLVGLLCFTAAPVLLGLFLAASLMRYHRRTAAG